MTTQLMNQFFDLEVQAESYLIENAFSTSKKTPLCLEKVYLIIKAVLIRWFPSIDESRKNVIENKIKYVIKSKCNDAKKNQIKQQQQQK